MIYILREKQILEAQDIMTEKIRWCGCGDEILNDDDDECCFCKWFYKEYPKSRKDRKEMKKL